MYLGLFYEMERFLSVRYNKKDKSCLDKSY